MIKQNLLCRNRVEHDTQRFQSVPLVDTGPCLPKKCEPNHSPLYQYVESILDDRRLPLFLTGREVQPVSL